MKNLYWDERAVNTAIHACEEIDATLITIHNAEVSVRNTETLFQNSICSNVQTLPLSFFFFFPFLLSNSFHSATTVLDGTRRQRRYL